MRYAPIIIPTMSRLSHLQRCIESLQKSTLANVTEVIISIDYPPTETYYEEYKALCQYLNMGITGFAKVKLIFQKENLGAYNNYVFLLTEVAKEYDSYIFTEDDNEFSPNFLEFINEGLERFRYDNHILAICSTGIDFSSDRNNVALSQNFSAQGYGGWIEKDRLFHVITRKYIEDIACSFSKVHRIRKIDNNLFLSFTSMLLKKEKLYVLPDNKIPIIDTTKKIYLIMEGKYVIAPCLQVSRNWGYDGTGENCRNNGYNVEMIKMDKMNNFVYKINEDLQVHRIKNKYPLSLLCSVCACYIQLFIWKLKKYLEI